MDLNYFLIFVLFFVASFSQGFSGFGFALLSLPLLIFFMPLEQAVPIVAIFGLLLNIYLIIKLKVHFKWDDIKKIFFGSIIGIPLGVLLLSEADSGLLKSLLAVLVIIFVIFNSFKIVSIKKLNGNWGYFAGFLAGLFGGAFNTNGPPILIYSYLKNWNKERQKVALTGFFLLNSILIVTAHLITEISTIQSYSFCLKYSPAVISGLLLGNYLFDKVSNQFYKKVILVGLLFGAIMLLFN